MNLRLFILAFVMAGCMSSQKKELYQEMKQQARLHLATKGEHRSDANRSRDAYRNPKETLNFFEVQPQHTVVEVYPGSGWYTEILAPYLKDDGKLILALPPETTEKEHFQKYRKTLLEKMSSQKDVFGSPTLFSFEPPKVFGPIANAGSVDRVLTFRNFHSWMGDDSAEKAMKAFFEALKPGGILGIVDHRVDPKAKWTNKDKSGYIPESKVIELAEKAGFQFVASSPINHNPKDTKDYKDGVWTLPPSLRLKEKDRAKYLAVGESDRFTLKFRKP